MAGSNSVEGGAFRLQVDSPWQPNLPEARKLDLKPEIRVVANVRYYQIVEAQCKADERGIRKKLPTIRGLVKSKLSDEDYVKANAEIAEAKAEAAEQKKNMKTLERFKEDNPDVKDAEARMAESQRLLREQMAAESDLMDFQFDGTADKKDDQSKEVAILRAAVHLATATAALTHAQNNDRQLQLQFTVAHTSDFNMWKKRKARDGWAEIVATKSKLDDLVEEYEDLAVEDAGDDDYVPESDTSESDENI
ncbi:hypothetical protein KC357_g6490 [Hortaea werneckii]|nr:hypothetical protein KC357_g6490 [Hortaea werneckii]